jgi:serine/threonine-protein kinase HipA
VPSRALDALIDTGKVGALADDNGVWSFTYAPQWVAAPDSYPLSPHLPLGEAPIVDSSSARPVQWYFDNLLPEEGARVLLAKDAHVDAADAFGLLAYYGAESAGSVTLTAAGTEPATGGGERPLANAELQTRIEKLPQISLSAGARKRMSLAGAQHKLAVIYRDGELFEPVGSTPSTHILKPNHTDPDYPHTVANEYFAMRLAARLDLDVPSVHRLYIPASVYLVERFDREVTAAGVRRLHVIDACQLLNLDRAFKYREGSIARLAQLAETSSAPAASRIRLFSWLVFNVLIGNGDAHLKNLSFLVTHRGVALAPAYDLLAVGVYDTPVFGKDRWPATELAWPLPDVRRFADATGERLVAAARELGLARETATRLLIRMATRIAPVAQRLLEDILAENERLLADHPERAATLGGEARTLRAIVEVVIRDMAARLQS